VPRRWSSTPDLSEEWLGQRGLLAVGVLFVVLAAGYLLKLSFDRGWVSPLMRCVGGAVAGLALGALGWRLHARGTRRYGAALIGAGAAIVYLAVWAAGRLYQFLPPTPAVSGLALVSVALAAVAWTIEVEALASTAALGAFLAPIVIGREAGSVNLLLLYLGAMGAGLGTVAALRRWRMTAFVVALAYFVIATSGILWKAAPAGLYLYGSLGGAAGLLVALREGWIETGLLAFAGGWGVIGVANGTTTSHVPTLLGGLVLAVPVWWQAIRGARVWPDHRSCDYPALGDTFYFYVTPILLAAAVDTVHPAFDRHQGLAAALVALPYLAAGYSAERRPFALAGVTLLGAAAALQWTGVPAVWALLGLAHIWAGADHWLGRQDGRWYALGTLALALSLLVGAVNLRPASEPAFTGRWALGLWFGVETAAALGAGLFREPAPSEVRLRPVLWALAGALLLFGVTAELVRAFELSGLDLATARLAGGLAVSAWWILFAAGCFAVGFRLAIKPLRLAGFGVAGLALVKVLLVDLATLSAFYRIGSALILGVVSLGVAYAYHRRSADPRA
jgi:hypothetical protein